MVRTDKTLEIKGRLSDHAETIAKHTLSCLTSGQVLTIVTTDRSAKLKLSPLCESLGCVLLGIREERGTLYVQIRR
jgi:TusA-related sulfurtransferase